VTPRVITENQRVKADFTVPGQLRGCLKSFDVPRQIEFAATQAKPASVGWKNPNIVLVHEGGLCLCSSELYSNTVQLRF
jgi:hypothetical protein